MLLCQELIKLIKENEVGIINSYTDDFELIKQLSAKMAR